VIGRDARIAVVDVGSNSVRLFLCDGIDGAGPRGERLTTVTGLRRGAGPDGSIADAALARFDACLAAYAGPAAEFAPERVIAVGTSAVRDAPNRDRVGELLRARLGAELTVLGGQDEARCSFAGARLGAEGEEQIMVVDIGGGSTELVRGGPQGPDAAVSLQLGAVRQTEVHLASDPPTAAELGALREEAEALVRGGLEAIGGPAAAVGVAGTVTTLAAIDLGAYDRDRVHRHRLSLEMIVRITSDLARIPLESRGAVPGLDPARAGVIVAGALIAGVVLSVAGLTEMVVSERDLLDGVVLAATDPGGDLFRS
jgi:exopolyphosphatase/guanosine-5'-triphosphate,3'-diphosphate pyrophosphatase